MHPYPDLYYKLSCAQDRRSLPPVLLDSRHNLEGRDEEATLFPGPINTPSHDPKRVVGILSTHQHSGYLLTVDSKISVVSGHDYKVSVSTRYHPQLCVYLLASCLSTFKASCHRFLHEWLGSQWTDKVSWKEAFWSFRGKERKKAIKNYSELILLRPGKKNDRASLFTDNYRGTAAFAMSGPGLLQSPCFATFPVDCSALHRAQPL